MTAEGVTKKVAEAVEKRVEEAGGKVSVWNCQEGDSLDDQSIILK